MGAALLLYAWQIEPRRRRLEAAAVTLDRLPPALDGLTILHLSDLHLRAGDHAAADWLRALRAHGADLVVVTGDLIEQDGDADDCASVLGALAGRYSTIVVLGNHDHGNGPGLLDVLLHGHRRNNVARLVGALAAQGIDVLVNRGHPVAIGGVEIWVGGVDDPYQHRADAAAALAGAQPDQWRLLLAHSPDVLAQPAAREADLILAGHTHGGQVVLPLVGAVMTRTSARMRPAAGWFRAGRGWLHVSRGLGQTVPLRFRCPPEATLITLKAGRQSAVGSRRSAVSGRQSVYRLSALDCPLPTT